jgi:isopentenyl-diphosphate delta-isomerase
LQKVILVDENDRQIGTDDKLHAHQNGANLHRAISVFIFNKKGEMLLQRRTMTKYHSAGKWANACCSHPMPRESVADAAHRRLRQEMGFDCKMREVFAFTYKADVGNGLTEHEYDHVFFGRYDKEVRANKNEVMDYKWVSMKSLREEMARNPYDFAPWLRMCIDMVAANLD